MNYLVGDIGNTLTKISLLNQSLKITKSYFAETKKLYIEKTRKIFLKKIIKNNINKKILFSSVVPSIFKKIKIGLSKNNFSVYEIKQLNIKSLIKLNVDKVNQVGSDRIANAIGSFNIYKKDCLIIDFGTATTFDIISKKGIYEGGVIAPGISSSIASLHNTTALLPKLNLTNSSKMFGKNTNDALNAGFLWGYQGLINNIIDKVSKKNKNKFKIILTGGYANFFKKYLSKRCLVDQNITIKGIIKTYKDLLL
jgi:type III pantothenate kinase